MKKLKLSLVILLLVFVLAGCGTAPNETPVNQPEMLEGYSLFESDDYNVQYKDDWTNDETEVQGLKSRVFLSPEGTSTINIIKEDLPIKYTLEQYKSASLTNLKNAYTTAEFNEEKITMNGTDAYRITYSATVNGIDLTVSQTLVVKDKIAYVITFSGSDEIATEVYHNMENTFVIK